MLKRLSRGLMACLLLLLIAALLGADNWKCGLGDGKMNDGGGAWSFTACTSGSHFLGNNTEAYPNAAWAKRVFEERVQKAIIVIERNQKLDGNGRRIGDRAVAIFSDDSNSKRIASIFWVDDRYIRSIDSTSLDLALYCERLGQ